MYINHGFKMLEKSGVLIALILQSMMFQVHAADDSQDNATGANDEVTAVDTDASGEAEDTQNTYNFPRWPESNRPEIGESVPMAPPGPSILSIALSSRFSSSCCSSPL